VVTDITPVTLSIVDTVSLEWRELDSYDPYDNEPPSGEHRPCQSLFLSHFQLPAAARDPKTLKLELAHTENGHFIDGISVQVKVNANVRVITTNQSQVVALRLTCGKWLPILYP
jgi:hypothetical protein